MENDGIASRRRRATAPTSPRRATVRRTFCCFLAILAALSAWYPAALAADHVEKFNRARPHLQQQLRSKQPADRVEAIKSLHAFPIADATRLVCFSLSDSTDKVRETAYQTLVEMSDNQEVCDTLLAMAKKAVHRKQGAADAAPLLAVLLVSELPSVERETATLLQKLASTEGGAEVVLTMADELGSHGKAADVAPLARLAASKVFEQDFGVRRSVVQALTMIHEPAAIGALIDVAAKIRGEAQADAIEHLTVVTGQIFGLEGAAWQRWWADVKDEWEYPQRVDKKPYRSLDLAAQNYYYGLPLFAERMVFVLDTSGSMTGPRIVAAKRELSGAIANLPEYVSFSVVVFNGTVGVWQKKLVKATEQSKRTAIGFVNSQATQANTASYDALEMAFRFDAEAIYFLSDGAPHGGKITAPVDIVAAITAANKSRRISVYTIGIGVGLPGGPLEVFLKTLAEKNLGLFRRVDG